MEDEEMNKGQIEPLWTKRFNVVDITEEIKQICKNYFNTKDYSPEEGHVISNELAKLIRDGLLKKKDKPRIPRYKLSVQVFVGEKKEQKISLVSKGYWDNYVDNYATYTYETDTFYCSVIAFGFYTD